MNKKKITISKTNKKWQFYRHISGLIKVAGETTDEAHARNCTNKALGYLSVFKKQVDVNFHGRADGWTYLHLACYFDNVTFLRFILLVFKNIEIDSLDKFGQTPLDLAVERQNNDAIAALEAFKNSNEESRDIESFTEEFEILQSKYKVFKSTLTDVYNQDQKKVDEFMGTLCEVMSRLLETRKPFSGDLLFFAMSHECENASNVVLSTEENKEKEKKEEEDKQVVHVEHALDKKIQDMLNIETLYENCCDYVWLSENLLKSPIWLLKKASSDLKATSNNSKGLYDGMVSRAKSEQRKDQSSLQMDVRAIANNDLESYRAIVNFNVRNSKHVTKEQQRQDKIVYGIKGELTESELAYVSLYSTDMLFNASQMYDLDTYLSQLLLRAHILNTPFQQTVLSLFDKNSDHANGKNVWVEFGPVKKVKRCREKAELEYNGFPFPTSAHLLDLLRCTLIFDNFKDMLKGIHTLLTYCKKYEHVVNRKHLSTKSLVKFSILRVKNGFKGYIDTVMKKRKTSKTDIQTTSQEEKKEELIVPDRLCDIKFNIIVTLFDEDSKPISLIGEVKRSNQQKIFFYWFVLLQRMAQHKARIHELYEVERIESFFIKCDEKIKSKSIEKKISMAGIRAPLLAPLIVNHPFQFQDFLIKHLVQQSSSQNDDENKKKNTHYSCGLFIQQENFLLKMLKQPSLQSNLLDNMLSLIPEQRIPGLLLLRDNVCLFCHFSKYMEGGTYPKIGYIYVCASRINERRYIMCATINQKVILKFL
ncbi:hypothetical protein RFI_07638 [Reticulomyxa filosa]|uniref:Uncharacterized protein n=1 Tax=Reticulomyxa filosa TaxID=46433 RepID=X6NU17_RETFI|nr:hypothetical protein RFI_07638 [Reticulomyxa filosa]|eukprot:ETO29486.1 hypothetical protein RFI_07638 [Reticulomyxa filosa]